ncbi:cilia- and flagella-associated protein 161-like [Stegodyphus dumicola]|uniref:cilia- and flagella-associated protein 161-like n=1 Tax=Stegodyphus dumicola TaxID=202533 RepID=UPI0015B16E5F|nr:cilia- and flagella-associated protein 161-like [Stegodyphus dumicola]
MTERNRLLNIVCETSRDKRCRYANEKNEYHDPRLLLGNWREERAREEAAYEQSLLKQSKRDLPVQKIELYMDMLNKPVELTTNFDGFLHNKDTIQIVWRRPSTSLASSNQNSCVFLSALPYDFEKNGVFVEPCLATGSSDPNGSSVRSTFHVCRNDDRIPDWIPIMFGECITICTVIPTGSFYLCSEQRTPLKYAKYSGHQRTEWVKNLSPYCLWKIVAKDQNFRQRFSEAEVAQAFCGKKLSVPYVPVNEEVIITHVRTGQNLALEKRHFIKTLMGSEWEVSCHTYIDRNRKETEENFWAFVAPYEIPFSRKYMRAYEDGYFDSWKKSLDLARSFAHMKI